LPEKNCSSEESPACQETPQVAPDMQG